MLKPFYQGKLDTFCAIYAVLNAMRLIYGLRTIKARDILNDTILALANSPAAMQAVLNQTTDYVKLVDGMLKAQNFKYPMQVVQPWQENSTVSPAEFVESCQNWFRQHSKSAILLRFLRYLNADTKVEPLNRHWTVIDRIDPKTIHLFDCSHEAEAILNIKKDEFVTDITKVTADRLLVIQPYSVRFLCHA